MLITVSVLIPAFRATSTVGEAVRSVLESQVASSGDVEIVIAPDDGSTEYEKMFGQDPRIVVLEPTVQLGPGPSRNRAREAARGSWLTMLDADDTVVPGYLDELIDLAARTGSSCVFGRTRYEEQERVVREFPRAPTIDAASMAAFAGSVHSMYRRELSISYPAHLADDVFVDASILDEVGGSAPLANTWYRLQLRPDTVCATTSQDEFNAAYRQVLQTTDREVVLDVFAAKLAMGILFQQHVARGGDLSFHRFVAGVSTA